MASIITEDLQKVILEALKKGNTVELKKERGNLVVVEIERKKAGNNGCPSEKLNQDSQSGLLKPTGAGANRPFLCM